jgi:putative transcriptional regulator
MTAKYITAVFCIALWYMAVPLYGEVVPHHSGYETLHSHTPEDFAPHERRNTEPVPAKGRFLVASPKLKGSIFEQSVILLIDHSVLGTNGLIINKAGRMTASEVYPDIKELADHGGNIHLGGPVVSDQVYILVRSGNRPAESKEILQDLYLSLNMNSLKEDVISREEGFQFRVYIGYAGWSHGQLEQEIKRGGWYVMEGEQDIVFSEKPSLIWQELIRKRTLFYQTVFNPSDNPQTD